MTQVADIVGYNPDGQLSLLVEIKSKTDTSRPWATRLRRNILAHGGVPNSRFLLIALPDRLYLWRDVGNLAESVEPTYEIDATPFFRPYYEQARISPDQLSERSFELIVTSWLNELILSGVPVTVPEAQRQALLETGLLEALQGGSIAVEVPA